MDSEGFGLVRNEEYRVDMSGRREKRSEVDREEFGVARNEAYGLMCQARKKVMIIVYEDTEEPYEVML